MVKLILNDQHLDSVLRDEVDKGRGRLRVAQIMLRAHFGKAASKALDVEITWLLSMSDHQTPANSHEVDAVAVGAADLISTLMRKST